MVARCSVSALGGAAVVTGDGAAGSAGTARERAAAVAAPGATVPTADSRGDTGPRRVVSLRRGARVRRPNSSDVGKPRHGAR